MFKKSVCGRIKNYLELNKIEAEKLTEFINRNIKNKLSFEEIDKQFKSEEYDFGRGVILKINEEHIAGKALIILKECSKKGIAYVVNLDISEEIENKKIATGEIIEEVKNIAKEYGAREIFLGTRDNKIIRILNSLNLNKQYSAIKMTLEDRKIRYSPLKLVTLSDNNKKEYLAIYNDAFKEVPNGTTLTEREIDDYLNKADENKYYFIVLINNAMAGFLEFNIEDDVGEFDLGLIKSVRGKGYGKQLLETAIDFLNSNEVIEISLIVITKNTLAYNMYKKRGFKESKLISDWFVLG